MHVQPLHHLVDAHFAVEHEPAIAFFDNRLALDIVFVADLADNLFQQIFDRDEAGGAAVLVHHERTLGLLPLKLLQQLRDALRFRYDHRRPQQAGDRPRIVRHAERHQILHEHETGNVVEALAIDRKT